jgi:hypothetical protein
MTAEFTARRFEMQIKTTFVTSILLCNPKSHAPVVRAGSNFYGKLLETQID